MTQRLHRSMGVLAVGVFLALSVPPVLAAPQPGASCKVAGRERVTTAGTLRCASSTGRGLRWRLVSASQTTTPSSTTPATTTTAPASSSIAPRVSNVVADDTEVRFSLSGMSPDTNNYAVQWVQQGAAFTAYQMVRSTSKNVSISAQTFRCDRTYTFRVFAMRADWTLNQGHTNQNVTPHSDMFDVTMTHPCTGSGATSTTTTLPLTCAQGGTCVVGDTGPGGGTVFYVHASGTFSCGIGLNSTCKYLEFSPYGWNGGGDDPGVDWCNVSTDLDIDESGIGGGLANTTEADNTCTSGAIQTVASYTNNGLGDWYLPTKDESNELCKYARQQSTGDTSVGCASSGSVRSEFRSMHYWTSTEISGSTNAWSTEFGFGNQLASNKVPGTLAVRPIRAFGGTTGCADGGTCVVGDTGPGGGVVFYVHSSGTFTSTGSDCGTSCKYMETATSDQSTGSVWCSDSGTLLNVTAIAIGTGMANTTTADSTCSSAAIQIAADYSSFTKTDWHLPSKDELNELCKYAKNTGQAAGAAVVCSGGLDAALRGFTATNYWSSSEDSTLNAWQHSFFDGSRGSNFKGAPTSNRVRAVRAFG